MNKLLLPQDVVGGSFWLISVAMIGAAIFFFLERGRLSNRWGTAMNLVGVIALMSSIHYFYAKNLWVLNGQAPTALRYIDWLLTFPLTILTFYVILKSVTDVKRGMFWRLLVGTLVWVIAQLLGAYGYMSVTLGFLVGIVGWLYIIGELYMGDAGRIKATCNNESVQMAFFANRLIISIFFTILLSLGCSDSAGDQLEKDLTISEIKKNLSEMLPESIEIISIEQTDIEGYLEVNLKGIEPLFVSKDGKYLVSGDIFEITDKGLINKSEARKNYLRKTTLSKLDKSDFITFQPKKVEHSIFVFTDVDCGYCRQFHRQINDYLDLGIQVNYLAFPRSGVDSDSFNKIASAWCSSQPHEAITELKLGYEIKENICSNNPVEKHFNLGNSLGVSGTPSIITSEGRLIPGYIPPEELIGLLSS